MIKGTITNLDQFKQNLRILSKDIHEMNTDIINAACLQIAQESNRVTLKSSEAKILADMNRGSISGRGTVGEALVNAKRKSNNLPLLRGGNLKMEVDKMIAAKIASITYLKSGWLPAIRALSKIVKRSKSYSIMKKFENSYDVESVQIGVDKGNYKYARSASKIPIASITNSAGQGPHFSTAEPILMKGLQSGVKKLISKWNTFTSTTYLEFFKRNKY